MASNKTECTELAIGFGLLNRDPLANLLENEVIKYFEQTLSFAKYNNFKLEFSKDEELYRKFYGIGMNLRASYPLFNNLTSVRWEGGKQQAKSVSMAKDIIAANTAISIKAESHVVYNRSVHNLFISLPQGTPELDRTEDWYIKCSPQYHQTLYAYVREQFDKSLPEQVLEYYRVTTKAQRKLLAQKAKELTKTKEFNKLYLIFCHDVAQKSAHIFNSNIKKSLSSPIHNSIKDTIIRTFFRVGDTEYILCGLNEGQDFAVKIPDLTNWKQQWKFKSIEAIPDLDSKQPVVKFKVVFEEKQSKIEYILNFHVEIRWSHGKFGNNPEAKLYKDFDWVDVPFFQKVYEPSPIKKQRCIGSGGFGVVYEGVFHKQKVALKELSTVLEKGEEYARFCREVEIQSKLRHENILPVLKSDLSAKKPWFITPLAQGSLADILNELSGDYNRIDKIFRQLLAGMKHAHDNGVLHRDLKPENILLFDNDHIKIGDFGLGKAVDSSILTHTSNNSMGTLQYAAPEQVQSLRDADRRSDIYALGKTLMHMVTNETPLPLSVANLGNVDIRYRSLIEQCTFDNPEKRFQSIDEIIEVFEHIAKQ